MAQAELLQTISLEWGGGGEETDLQTKQVPKPHGTIYSSLKQPTYQQASSINESQQSLKYRFRSYFSLRRPFAHSPGSKGVWVTYEEKPRNSHTDPFSAAELSDKRSKAGVLEPSVWGGTL